MFRNIQDHTVLYRTLLDYARLNRATEKYTGQNYTVLYRNMLDYRGLYMIMQNYTGLGSSDLTRPSYNFTEYDILQRVRNT